MAGTEGTGPGTTPTEGGAEDAGVTFASQAELDAFVNAKIERAVKARLKNKPPPSIGPDPELQSQLEAAQKRIEEIEGANKSELEKALSRLAKMEAAAKAAEGKVAAQAAEFAARMDERAITEAILAYAKDASVPGSSADFVKIARESLTVKDGEVYAEDAESGRKLSVKQRLDAFRKEPGREIWNTAPAPGTGDRRSGQPIKPEAKDWRTDPVARERAAREELDKMRGRGPIVPIEGAPAKG